MTFPPRGGLLFSLLFLNFVVSLLGFSFFRFSPFFRFSSESNRIEVGFALPLRLYFLFEASLDLHRREINFQRMVSSFRLSDIE
jgi:hypothetical protein